MPAGITATDSMMSVREMPWHRLGVVLEEYPKDIKEAISKSGLGWGVNQGDVFVTSTEGESPIIALSAADKVAAAIKAGKPADHILDLVASYEEHRTAGADLIHGETYKGNIRDDTGDLLGIVSDEFKVVQNLDGFKFLDALIGSEMHFETAGSLNGGKRVWVLVRLPEFVEIGGDLVGTYLYVANAHDGSMSVTSAVTPTRIVCANTLGVALRRSDTGANAQRTFRFRHTGDLTQKWAEARKVMGITVNYEKQFKELGDTLASERMTRGQFERKVLRKIDRFKVDQDTPKRATTIRNKSVGAILDIFSGKGVDGDTTGNSPNTKWAAFNAVGEFSDHGRRVTQRTDQMKRSFEDTVLKDEALPLILAA